MSAAAALRAQGAEIIAAVLAGASLRTAMPDNAGDQRATLQALVYGTLRWHVQLDALVGRMLDRPLRRRDRKLGALLELALFELRAARTPAHAVVAESVSASARIGAAHARGLVNALLRRYLRERDALEEAIQAEPHVAAAHPRWLHDRVLRDWPGEAGEILAANNEEAPQWLRVNLRATDRDTASRRIEDVFGVAPRPSPHVATALALDTPVPVDALPGFADGEVSVQDAAAQLAAPLLGAAAGERVLDACAAPGGKTAHIAEFTDCRAAITALDLDAERLARVSDNLDRLGLDNVTVREGDACAPETWWDGKPYDRILVDAPCSATGVIRRHPDIRVLRRESDIAALAKAQRDMLDALWPLLAPGGRLVYASCSVLSEENAQTVTTFETAHEDALARALPQDFPGRVSGPGRQILTGEAGMDGFYYACLTKNGHHDSCSA